MKLYMVHAKDVPNVWCGTQACAAKARKHLNTVKKIPRDLIHTEEVDIPTDKKGLLAWLGEHCRG